MPDINSITINNGAATPVAKVFNQYDLKGDVIVLANREATAHMHADKTITMSSRQMGDGSRKIRFKVNMPVHHDATAEGGSSAGYEPGVNWENMFAELTFKIPNFVDEADRKNLAAYAANLLAESQIVTTLENAEGIW